jgi:DNA-binding MarR family transcriptional regulator
MSEKRSYMDDDHEQSRHCLSQSPADEGTVENECTPVFSLFAQELLPVYLVTALQRQLRRTLDATFAEMGLSITQYAALSMVREGRSPSATEIAQRLSVRRQAVSKTIVDLELRGLVQRAPHPTHGRVLELSLTERGRALVQACDQHARQIAQQMLDGVTPEQQSMLIQVLQQCLANLDDEESKRLLPFLHYHELEQQEG